MEGFETYVALENEAQHDVLVRGKFLCQCCGVKVAQAKACATLRINLVRECFGAGGGEFEAEEPLARDVFAVRFGWGECPILCGADCGVGEILAWAGGFEARVGDFACRIHI
jgi:hypothetical protein